MFYLEIWIGLCFRTESAFPGLGTFYSRQNTFSLPLLRLDNDGTAVGPKTTPNTLDWHLLALFAGWLKVTYQGFDSHPDTYFMAEAEIKKLRSANLFWINQPNNLNLRTKSFLLFRLLEHCLIIKFWSRQIVSSIRNSIYMCNCVIIDPYCYWIIEKPATNLSVKCPPGGEIWNMQNAEYALLET